MSEELKSKFEALQIGKTYNVSYMPTKYLYERTGTLKFKSDTNLKFDDADYEHFFLVQPKHLIDILELTPPNQ